MKAAESNGIRCANLSLDNIAFRASIRLSRRAKRIGLRILTSDHVEIVVPAGYGKPDIGGIILHHRRWLIKHLQTQRNSSAAASPFLPRNGSILPLLDKKLRLRISVQERESPAFCSRDGTLFLEVGSASAEAVLDAVRLWYTGEAYSYLARRIPFWGKKLDVSAVRISVGNQKTIWGSCSRNGHLRFNWRIMFLDPEAADYLILHELAHLQEMNHSPAFWSLVSRFCPDYRNHRKALKAKSPWLSYPPR